MTKESAALSPTRFRWVVVLLLFSITVINYIDRSAIAFAMPAVERELGLTPEQVGLVLGAFGLGYAVPTLLGGMAVDRFGPRAVLATTAAFWALSIGITGAATGFLLLYLARTLLGLAEGPSFPAMNGAVGRWLSPHEQAGALAGALVAVPVALAVGGPLTTQLLAAFGWRGLFYILAALSLLWVPVWLVLFRNDPARSRHVDRSELAAIHQGRTSAWAVPDGRWPSRQDWRILLTNPTLLSNSWAFFVFGYFLFFFMGWLPSYLKDDYGLDLQAVGYFSVLPWAAAAVTLLLAGRLSDRLLQRTGRLRLSRTYPIAASQFIAALAVLPVGFTSDLNTAIVCITIAVAASMAANAAYFAVTLDVLPRKAATALGFMDACFAIAGFVSPAVTGWVYGLRGSFLDAFLLLSAVALSSVVSLLLFHHPDRDRAEAV